MTKSENPNRVTMGVSLRKDTGEALQKYVEDQYGPGTQFRSATIDRILREFLGLPRGPQT